MIQLHLEISSGQGGDIAELKKVGRRATKIFRRLEHLFYGERLANLGIFSVEQMMVKRKHEAVYKLKLLVNRFRTEKR